MLTEAERYKLVFDFQQHQNVSKVAKAHKVSKATVRHWVRVHAKTGVVAGHRALQQWLWTRHGACSRVANIQACKVWHKLCIHKATPLW